MMSDLCCGSVINWKDFYKDASGTSKNKLFIVIGTKKGGLLAITTSQKHSKISTMGCYKVPNSYFFIQQNKNDFFDRDTWILLYSIKEVDINSLLNLKLSGRIEVIGNISGPTLNAILNCARKSDDVMDRHIKMLD